MNRRRWLVLSGVATASIVVLGGVVAWSQANKPICDFPTTVAQTSADLPLYCPDAVKLPSGVQSHVNAATAQSGAVVYGLQDGSTTLSVSLQTKPVQDKLTNFIANIIPLNIDTQTKVGKGYIGVTPQGQSLLDLPTTSKTWILVAGPKDYPADRMIKIAQSFVLNN